MKTNHIKSITAALLATASLAVSAEQALPPTAAIHKLNATGDWRADEVRQVISFIQKEIARAGLLRFVERREMSQLFDELEHSQAGIVRQDDYINFGQQFGVRYVLVGELSETLSDGKEVHSPLGGGRTLGRIVNAELTASVRLIDTTTAAVECDVVESATRRYELSKTERVDDAKIRQQLARDVAQKIARAMKEEPLFAQPTAPTAEAAKVSITINSEPPGADVIINTVLYGNAPGKFSVPVGAQEISVDLEGYTPWTRQVNCAEGQVFTAKLKEIREPDVVVVERTDVTVKQ